MAKQTGDIELVNSPAFAMERGGVSGMQSSRWLATYVALSRVRTLAQLRSIGLTPNVREIIEMGPPEGIPGAFNELFGDLEVTTKAAAMEALIELGWR